MERINIHSYKYTTEINDISRIWNCTDCLKHWHLSALPVLYDILFIINTARYS